MESERYERYYAIGFGLTVVVLAGLVSAWALEGSRMEHATQHLTKERIQRGRALYVSNCVPCHGSRGEGGVGKPLNDKRLLKVATDQVLIATVRAGRPGTTMPAWAQENGGSLTDEDVRDIVAFIRAWEPTAPELKLDVSTPSAERGARLFANACFVCHGEDGKGGIAPALNRADRLSQLDDAWYRETIANGRPAKGMPTWGTVLSPNQIEDLVALIRAWRGGERVIPETTVAELLQAGVFMLGQSDARDALFYLKRAQPLAFGPASERIAPIIKLIEREQINQALTELAALQTQWPIGDAQQGAAIFKDTCQGCHGAEGQGGVGRRLHPNDFVKTSTNAQLLTFLRTGRPGTSMRGFAERLNERQMADVIAFVHTWQEDSPSAQAAGSAP